MSDDNHTVLLIHGGMWRSLVSDSGPFITAAGLIGLRCFLGSDAMQWAGFIVMMVCAIAPAVKRSKRVTPQQAADRLRDQFGVRAK